MLILFNPASFSALAFGASFLALVVKPISFMPGIWLILATKSTIPFLTNGSPPVSLTLLIPKLVLISTKVRISSYDKISSCDFTAIPCSGIQYRQRKSQRSVTEMRK